MTSLAEYRMSNTDLNKESILYILTSVTRCFSDAEKKRHGINWCLVMMLGLFIGISVSGCDRKEPVEQRPTAQSAFVQAESVRIQRRPADQRPDSPLRIPSPASHRRANR